jgi:hypothetical protein
VIRVVDSRPVPDLPAGEHEGVGVVYAARPGSNAADDRIVEPVASGSTAADVHVVTSDRALQGRIRRLEARVESAGAWLRKLDAASPPWPPAR